MSDFSDPEFDELEPVQRKRRKETKMVVKHHDEQEQKAYAVTGPVVIGDRAYSAGEHVLLTEEQHQTLVDLGAPVEGVEPKTAEQVQSDHEAGVKAQEAEIKRRAEEEEEDDDADC